MRRARLRRSVRCRKRALLCIALISLPACQPAVVPEEQAVAALIDALIAADNAADVDRIASFYQDDAVLLPPSGAPVHGRDAIRRRYEEGFRRFELRLSLKSRRLRVAETLAYGYGETWGEYVWRDGSPPTPFRDGYMMALERDASGEWRISALMWRPHAEELPETVEGDQP